MALNRTNIPWGTGMALSVVFVTVGLYFLLFIVQRIGNPVAGLGIFILVVPLFPSVSAILQGERKAGFDVAALLYIYELFSLAFDILLILLAAPVVALGALSLMAFLILVVSVIGLIVWAVKFGAGADIAPGVDRDSHLLMLAIAAGSLAYIMAWILAQRCAARSAMTLTDRYVDTRARVRSALRRRIMDRENHRDAQ